MRAGSLERDHAGPDETLRTEQSESDDGGPGESESDDGGPGESESDEDVLEETQRADLPESDHGGPDKTLHIEQLESGAQAEGPAVYRDDHGQASIARGLSLMNPAGFSLSVLAFQFKLQEI
ncbi:hypothetical protein MRX96_031008 [Rhipicephalus microplus]